MTGLLPKPRPGGADIESPFPGAPRRQRLLRPQNSFVVQLPAAELSFVPVVGATDAPRADILVAPAIEVEVGGAVVRVPPGADAKLLIEVRQAVKSVT